MNSTEFFIRRRITTTLLMAAISIFGLLAYFGLPVSDLPAIDFPTITVSASQPGASPETMANTVATPLEREFTSLQGISSINSTSSIGATRITLQFDLSRNIDAAAQDVQAAISAASRDLPQNMPQPPDVPKGESGGIADYLYRAVVRSLCRCRRWMSTQKSTWLSASRQSTALRR